MDRIIVSGMQFYGRHGVHDFETQNGQVFVVDVEMTVDLAAASGTDDLEHTVNYGAVFATVESVVTGKPFKLIEAVAGTIAGRVLAEYPPVAAVTVRVHKPRAPIPGSFADVWVELTRQRG